MVLILLASFFLALSETAPAPAIETTPSLEQVCMEAVKSIPGSEKFEDMQPVCAQVKALDDCKSVHGTPIFHFDKTGTSKNPKRIFAKALIHGDEILAGVVARSWMARLAKIETRNTWRVILVANPDGWKARTRTNANGVDLNRNFPTKDWEGDAIGYWKKKAKADPRGNPGPSAASEPETKCLLHHLEEFKPDFLISVHTPLGVLDLDGPKMKNPPSFRPLPWTPLGNFPGSLGRYMWVDRKIPVLTI